MVRMAGEMVFVAVEGRASRGGSGAGRTSVVGKYQGCFAGT